MEILGERSVPATCTVIGLGDGLEAVGQDPEDPDNPRALIASTLRAAINEANRRDGPDTIAFRLGSGQKTISPTRPLPAISDKLVIDGTTQPGFDPSEPAPLITINGSKAGDMANGLTLTANGNTILGLTITGFARAGVRIENSSGNLIGGTARTATERATGVVYITHPVNVIAKNGEQGISIVGADARNNKIQGNFIGTTAAGDKPAGNRRDGILIENGSGNRIGLAEDQPNAGQSNLISGNGRNGVYIEGASAGLNVVQGNFIGTDPTGAQQASKKLGNDGNGVLIEDGPAVDANGRGGAQNQIGGSRSETISRGNLISNNKNDGIQISGSGGNFVQGNLIGTDKAGNQELGNVGVGVRIKSGVRTGTLNSPSINNVVGGRQGTTGNVISGNKGLAAIVIEQGSGGLATDTKQNKVIGNLIGTTLSGSAVVAEKTPEGAGVIIRNSAGNTIGGDSLAGDAFAERNVISGNFNGVVIHGQGATGNRISGNLIGTDSSGKNAVIISTDKLPFGNVEDGVLIENNGPTGNVIRQNVVAANGGNGVFFKSGKGNTVSQNLIGLPLGGSRTNTKLGNGLNGVAFKPGAVENTVIESQIAFSQGKKSQEGGAGIRDENAPHGNTFRNNEIFRNNNLGIDVAPVNKTTTVSVPVLTSALFADGRLTIKGSLTTDVQGPFVIQFFLNHLTDGSGFGEGEFFIGESADPVQGKGIQFTESYDIGATSSLGTRFEVQLGDVATATATIADQQGRPVKGTAEFSKSFTVNFKPKAANDAGATDEATVLLAPVPGVLVNDTDPDSDALAVSSFDSVSALGAAVAVAANGSYTYDPTASAMLNALAEGETVIDSFNYTIGDGQGGFATATVLITVLGVNDAPTAAIDAYFMDEDSSLDVLASGVLANDSDPDGDPLTAVLVDGPANGSLTLNDDGSFNYTPNANFNGTDSFTYKANDGLADSNPAAVSIAVNSVAEATTTTLTSSSPVTITNVPVLLTATVGSASGTPTGSVQFLVDGFAYGSPVALVGGSASIELNGLFAGQYTVSALYSGDGDFAASAGVTAQAVSPAPTEVRVTSLMNPAEYGGSGTLFGLAFRATPPSGFFPIAPTGIIILRDDFQGTTTVLSMFELGQPLPPLPQLEVGTHSIVMVYSGDFNFLGSISDPLLQEIVPPPESPGGPFSAEQQAVGLFFAQSS
jgi:VCBS repeat-containing protein